jgi:hypothetical protein
VPLQLGRDRAFDPTNRAFSNDSQKAEVFLFLVCEGWFFVFLFFSFSLSSDRAFDPTNRARFFCSSFFPLCGGVEWQLDTSDRTLGGRMLYAC